ncbi:hypothetical protein EVAR_70967_1 [Eumeta japonica]|uniref:Uncharacterized protein n=1 Tax=Eumeta variegata TaxID=151549 RepID=A0A4C1SMZ3_EUMVA|nr:hypothetical protein EVAR_70967_1 [Eumeta japonica]
MNKLNNQDGPLIALERIVIPNFTLVLFVVSVEPGWSHFGCDTETDSAFEIPHSRDTYTCWLSFGPTFDSDFGTAPHSDSGHAFDFNFIPTFDFVLIPTFDSSFSVRSPFPL